MPTNDVGENMKIDETIIVYREMNPQVPCLLYRSGKTYFLHCYYDTETPLRQIDIEEAWKLQGIAEPMKEILRKD